MVKNNYHVEQLPDGGYTISGGTLKYKIHLRPLEETRREAELEIRRRGRLSGKVYEDVRKYGLLNTDRPRKSIRAGAELLGIATNEEAHYYNFLERADHAFRHFWKAHEVERYVHDPVSHPLPSISDFKKEHPNSYKWIKSSYRGGESGSRMARFMEDRRPGLYRLLVRRTNDEAIDFEKIKTEIQIALGNGIPISEKYLWHSPDPRHRKLSLQIKYILDHKGLFLREKEHSELSKCNTFTQTAAYLGDISNSEIRAGIRGAGQCGKLAEKYVQAYIVWTSRGGYDDPLRLGLPDFNEIHFEHSRKRFRYSSRKMGWADGRIGNTAIEVKADNNPIFPGGLKEIIDKYGGKSVWRDGKKDEKPMDGAILFLHQEPRKYEKALLGIENHGIRVIEFNQFHQAFLSLIEKVEQDYHVSEGAYPNINFRALTETHAKMGLEKTLKMLSKQGLQEQRKWVIDMLEYLIKKGEP